MRIFRQTLDGKKWPPAVSNGHFVLGDPRHGNAKHTEPNAVRVRTEDEAIGLIRSGYSIRIMTPNRPSMIRKNLFIDGAPIS